MASPEGRTTAVPARHSGFIAVGAVMLMLASVLWVARPRLVHIAPLLPATMLRPLAIADEQLWPELEARGLAARDQRLLAETILDKRSRSSLGDHQAMDWLEGRRLARALPEDLERQYFAESTLPELQAPNTVRPGERFEIRIGGEDRSLGGDLRAHLAASIFVNGSLVHRTARAVPSFYLDSTPPARIDEEFQVRAPSVEVTAPEDRPSLEIEARVHRIVRVGWVVEELTWEADGNLALSEQAIWQDTIVLRRSVEVRP